MPPKPDDPEIDAELETKFNDCVTVTIRFDERLLPQLHTGIQNAKVVHGTKLMQFPIQHDATKYFLKTTLEKRLDEHGDNHTTVTVIVEPK